MTYSPMQNLAEFHDKFDRDGKGRHERPISVSLIFKRLQLIREEYDETDEALTTYSIVLCSDAPRITAAEAREHLAKELADLLYVVYGTAEELGIPLEEVFNEVHQSNMQKIWPDGQVHYNEFGKVMKPPAYSAPDISGIMNTWNT